MEREKREQKIDTGYGNSGKEPGLSNTRLGGENPAPLNLPGDCVEQFSGGKYQAATCFFQLSAICAIPPFALHLFSSLGGDVNMRPNTFSISSIH